ncbi:MAG: NAD(P)-dependent alcohol dehydrogenase [Anaerolineae bacterium]|nr:NAD(P)-dependent alcohol dehydrogenase [Anaerolineae bacterium]
MEVRAAVILETGGEFELQRLELSEPNDDEVLVRIVGAGICGTDLGAVHGHLPIPSPPSVFGHEGAGIVENVGARVTKVKPGDHVVLAWDYCGVCTACKLGKELSCLNFFLHNFHGARADGSATLRKGDEVVHGCFLGQSSFADFALANQRSVVKVREDVPLEILAPMGCGVMTGAGAVMNSLRPAPGSSIAVFGVGPVGMSAVLAGYACGCTTIIAVDVKADRLNTAKELGATHTINAGEVDPVEAILDITSGGPEFSLECVGNPKVFRQAVDVLPRLGVCGLAGVVPPMTEVSLNMDLIMNGRTVKGILGGDAIADLFIPRLIELYSQGRFPFDRMITFYPFDEINQAVKDMAEGRVLKPVLRP